MRLNNRVVLRGLALAGCVVAMAGQAQQRAVPPAMDDARDGPPPATGPSGTSDRDAARFDEVGRAAVSDDPGYVSRSNGASPGSFIEITSLQTGKVTIGLVVPGAPSAGALVEVSPAIAAAIGAVNRGEVRVRAITPAPTDQTALNRGEAPAPRLDAPPALLAGLRARFDRQPQPAAAPLPRKSSGRVLAIGPRPVAPSAPSAQAKAQPGAGAGYYVQLAAFGSADRANALARSIGGAVAPAGSLYRVRLGPFATQADAVKARGSAAAHGYPDARITRDK